MDQNIRKSTGCGALPCLYHRIRIHAIAKSNARLNQGPPTIPEEKVRGLQAALQNLHEKFWQSGRYSGPPSGFPGTRFRSERFQPLGHLSAIVAHSREPRSEGNAAQAG